MAGYGFSKDDHARVSSVVRQVEGASRGGKIPARGNSNYPWNPGSVVARSGASTIAALSGSTPGSGTVTLYSFNGSTLTSGSTVTAYNVGSAAVAANKWLILSYAGGYWWIVVEACA